jgi:hypothetical protein
MVRETLNKTKKAFMEKMITLILGGFGLVAALAWNEAIKSLFDVLFKKSNGIIGKFVYAALITFIVVIVSLRLKKISENSK